MSDLPSAEEISTITGILAPGIIILWVRSRFRDSVLPKMSEQALSYAIVSVTYNAAAYPFFHASIGISLPSWLWFALLNVFTPIIVGVAFVFADNSEKFYEICDRLGLRPVHHEPTAWDKTFRKRTPCYVIVHLTDGSTVYGAWVGQSFASTTSNDRDLYLDQVFNEKWDVVDSARSMLICNGSIRMVEFILGDSNERQ